MTNPSRIFGAIGITGGTQKSLDSIPSNLIKDGDVAIVCDGSNIYFYTLNASSNLEENIPLVIKPDDVDLSADPLQNNKRWFLISQKYFVDNIILQLNNYLQTSQIKAIENQPLKFVSSDGNIITISSNGEITLNNTTVNGQLTVINDGRRPPFIVDSMHKVINLNADKVDGYDADRFMFTDGSKPFTAPVQGVNPINSNELTTKEWVENYILQIENTIYTYIDNAIAAVDVVIDTTELSNRINAHVLQPNDDHLQYIHVDGRRNFTNVVGGVYPTLSNHLTTKQYVDDAISSIVTTHVDLLGLDSDDHVQYIHVDSRRGFQNPILGKTPYEDFHLATKEYVDEKIANIFQTKNLQIHTFDHVTSEWVINHNFNNKYIVIDFYEKFTNKQIKPDRLVIINDNTAIAYFSYDTKGYAVVSGITQHYDFIPSLVWNIEHTFTSKYVIFNIFDEENEEIFPDETIIIDDTHIQFIFSEPKQGYAVLSNDVTVFEFNSSSLEWEIFHNYNNKNLLVNCFNSLNQEIIPKNIEATDDNTILLTFEEPEEGFVIISGSEATILDPGLFIINHNHLRNLDSDDHLHYPNLDGSRAFTGTISGIYPTASTHLTTKQYVDDQIENALNIEILADHSELTGLNNDDHLQYILVNGSRGFTNPVNGITPTLATHLATKQYVDAIVNTSSATAQRGIMTLPQGVDNITISLFHPLSNYTVSLTIENLVDGAPSIYTWIVRQKLPTSFSVEFSGYIDSVNYKVNWIVYPLN